LSAKIMAGDGRKDDRGKHQMSLLGSLWRPLRAIVRVLEHGEAKYARDNWQQVKDPGGGWPITRYSDALQRHVADFMEGRTADVDTGLHPLAHAGCDVLFLLWFLVDDEGRSKERKSAHLSSRAQLYNVQSSKELPRRKLLRLAVQQYGRLQVRRLPVRGVRDDKLRELIQKARDAKWNVEVGGSTHVKFVDPNGKYITSCTTTKTSPNTYYILRSKLRRAGLDV